MNRRPALLCCALALMTPTPVRAEYPHYLNVVATHHAASSADSGAKFRMAAANPGAARLSRSDKAKPVSTSAAPPARTVDSLPEYRESSGAWLTQCWTAPAKRCEVLQQQIDKTTGQQILLIGFSLSQSTIPQLTIVTSPEIKARNVVSVSADKQTFVEAPLKGCIAAGCVHILDISPDQIARLSSSKDADTTVQLADDRFTKISVNIDGLSNSMEKALQFIN
jgi:invasion protein IalB